jgi:high-affinity nickel-transport protein
MGVGVERKHVFDLGKGLRGSPILRRWRGLEGYRLRFYAVVASVAFLQIIGWLAVAMTYGHRRALVALAAMAFVLGLKHALDADHIAAIDNVSRSIAGRGDRAAAVGFFFALGHSSIVALTSLLIATTASKLSGNFAHVRELASATSTILSVTVLFVIAPRNILIAARIYRTLRHPNAGMTISGIPASGPIAALIRPLLRLKVQSWHMLGIGALFGLGFETATAIAVLALAGAQAGVGGSVGSAMIFPLLFAGGMTLVDASDGILMERAYGWAMQDPRRHAVYNLVVTSFSATLALVVGGIELAAAARHGATESAPRGLFLSLVGEHFDAMGAAIVATFVVIWMAAVLFARFQRARRPA